MYVSINVHVVVHIDVRTAIPPIVIVRVTVVRMAEVTVVINIQMMMVPAD